MHARRYRLLRYVAGLAAAGTCFQFLGCSFRDVFGFVRDFNPCGSILNCDPLAYRFLTSGYRGPGADPDIDPACTFPPFCEGDPFLGGPPGP